MCVTAALLVPGLRTLSDQFELCIAFGFRHRTAYRDFVFSEKTVMIDLNRVDVAVAAEVVRLRRFVSHDTAGDGNDPSFFCFSIQVSAAVGALNHILSLSTDILASEVFGINRKPIQSVVQDPQEQDTPQIF